MWYQWGVQGLVTLNCNQFPVKEKIPWIVELESALEDIEKLPQGGHPRWRGKDWYMGKRIGERRIWKSYDKLLCVNVDLEQVSYIVLV